MLKMDDVIQAIVPRQASLLGGRSGGYRLISNIHTIEDQETAKFIREHELIFITGVALAGDEMLEQLIRSIAEKHIAGIIINTGFYIHTVPSHIIEFCNHKEIPLLSLPWKYILSDLQKTIFKELALKQYKDDYTAYMLEQILHRLYTSQADHVDFLSLKEDERFCVALLDLNEPLEQHRDLLRYLRTLPSVLYVLKEELLTYRIVILFRQSVYQTVYHEKNLKKWLFLAGVSTYKVGIGQLTDSWKDLASSYAEAELAIMTALELSYDQPFIISFKNISLLKVIQSISDTELLKNFVSQTLGKLEEYDKRNGTNLMLFLQIWIKHSGKPSAIANEMFIHRNTVSYRINKIKSILGYTELTYPIISNLFLAFVIQKTAVSQWQRSHLPPLAPFGEHPPAQYTV